MIDNDQSSFTYRFRINRPSKPSPSVERPKLNLKSLATPRPMVDRNSRN